jgi:hypothetical protein
MARFNGEKMKTSSINMLMESIAVTINAPFKFIIANG